MTLSTKHKNIRKAFGQVLAAERKKAGLSQEALAQKCRRQRTYISLLERGMNSPSLDVLFDLAQGLDVEVSYIVQKVSNHENVVSSK